MVKEYKKECKLQDVILCKDVRTGYLECFHRFDIMGREELQEYDMSPTRPWAKEEDEYLIECIKQNKTMSSSFKNLESENRTQDSMTRRIHQLKKEMESNGQ